MKIIALLITGFVVGWVACWWFTWFYWIDRTKEKIMKRFKPRIEAMFDTVIRDKTVSTPHEGPRQ